MSGGGSGMSLPWGSSEAIICFGGTGGSGPSREGASAKITNVVYGSDFDDWLADHPQGCRCIDCRKPPRLPKAWRAQ